MGNRAVITFDTQNHRPCMYLHWNGGMASVKGFLEAARRLGLRCKGYTVADQTLAMDQLAELLARHYFGCDVGMTIYRQTYGRSDADNGDNGTYVIGCDDLAILYRMHNANSEELNQAKTDAIIEHILARAPAFTD